MDVRVGSLCSKRSSYEDARVRISNMLLLHISITHLLNSLRPHLFPPLAFSPVPNSSTFTLTVGVPRFGQLSFVSPRPLEVFDWFLHSHLVSLVSVVISHPTSRLARCPNGIFLLNMLKDMAYPYGLSRSPSSVPSTSSAAATSLKLPPSQEIKWFVTRPFFF